jgi:hypothetical protein
MGEMAKSLLIHFLLCKLPVEVTRKSPVGERMMVRSNDLF